MRLSTVMKTDLVTVTRDATIAHARMLMRLNRVSHLPVMGGDGLVGVVSERDIRAPFVRDLRSGTSTAIVWFDDLTVGDVMSDRLVTLPAASTVREAAACLRDRRIGCVLVMEGANLVGVVTTADLLDLLAGHRPSPTHPHEPRRWRGAEGGEPSDTEADSLREPVGASERPAAKARLGRSEWPCEQGGAGGASPTHSATGGGCRDRDGEPQLPGRGPLPRARRADPRAPPARS